MNSVFILLNSLNDWKPYCETDSLMTVTDYLEHRYGERTPKLVINLSDEYGYNSEGYYCSLLAQARGHQVRLLPTSGGCHGGGDHRPSGLLRRPLLAAGGGRRHAGELCGRHDHRRAHAPGRDV